MKNWKNVILVLIIVASLLVSVFAGAGILLLSPYKQSRVPNEFLEIGYTDGQTEFYRFDKNDRERSLFLPQKLLKQQVNFLF